MKIIKFILNNLPMSFFLLALVIAQALCIVELPEYISKIVDIGIRNNGIEHAVPLRIRESEKEKTRYFISDENIWNNFDIQEINGGRIYVLKEDADIQSLNYEFGRAITAVRLINKATDLKESGVNISIFKGIAQRLGLKLSMMSTEEILKILNSMHPNDIELVNEIIDEKLELVTETEIVQVASEYLAEEYKVCGIGDTQKRYIAKTIIEMLALTTVLFVINIVESYFMNVYQTIFSLEMRKALFNKVVSDAELDDKKNISSLVNRTVYDTQLMENAVPHAVALVGFVPVCIIGTYHKVRKLSSSFESVLTTVIAIGIVIGLASYAVLSFKSKRKQKELDRINSIERDSFNNLFIVRNSGMEKQLGKFNDANNELVNVTTSILEFKYMVAILVGLIANLAGSYILWQGGLMVDNGAIGIGALMAVLDYLFQLSFVCSDIFKHVIESVSGYVSYIRCLEVLGKPKKRKSNGITIDNINKIEFRNVCFKYNNSEEYVLNNFSLLINSSDKILLKGVSSFGKSTLIKLLLKLYKIESGEILVNDINIENIDTKSLRRKIGVVFEQNDIFYGSVQYNVLLGAKISEERLNKVAEITEITDILSENKNVGYKGKNISGGQRQRVAISRAIVTKPDVLFLDNAYSSVDENTKMRISKRIEEEFKEKIVIMIEKEENMCGKDTRIVEM